MNNVQFLDVKSLKELESSSDSICQYNAKYLSDMLENGIRYYYSNIDAELYVMQINKKLIPIVVTNDNFQSSYVCSTYSYYISYALEYLHMIKNDFLRNGIEKVMKLLGFLGKKGKLNSVAYVNNWLFSTDLYPSDLTKEELKAIVQLLVSKFPKHAIAYRSINAITTNDLKIDLESIGFDSITTRKIFITDAKNEDIFKTRILKSDLKLMRESHYKVDDETSLTRSDYPRILELYKLLYIEEHSELHPQMNQKLLDRLIDKKLFQFKFIRINGQIEGIAGYVQKNGYQISPFFGLNKKHPEQATIYRLICTALLLEARNKGLIFNQSSGASFFKSVRRAQSCIETMSVYSKHLAIKQQMPWLFLKTFMNKFAIRYVESY